MASDGSSGTITTVIAVLGSQASSGKSLPQSGKSAAATAASIPAGNVLPRSGKPATVVVTSAPAAASKSSTAAANDANSADAKSADAKSVAASRSDPQTLVSLANKYLNDSGRPDQFRVDPSTSNYIQQVNPSSGAVIAEYSVSEFPALARSLGASGLLIDDIA